MNAVAKRRRRATSQRQNRSPALANQRAIGSWPVRCCARVLHAPLDVWRLYTDLHACSEYYCFAAVDAGIDTMVSVPPEGPLLCVRGRLEPPPPPAKLLLPSESSKWQIWPRLTAKKKIHPEPLRGTRPKQRARGDGGPVSQPRLLRAAHILGTWLTRHAMLLAWLLCTNNVRGDVSLEYLLVGGMFAFSTRGCTFHVYLLSYV